MQSLLRHSNSGSCSTRLWSLLLLPVRSLACLKQSIPCHACTVPAAHPIPLSVSEGVLTRTEDVARRRLAWGNISQISDGKVHGLCLAREAAESV